jgi:hypothetical protein
MLAIEMLAYEDRAIAAALATGALTEVTDSD